MGMGSPYVRIQEYDLSQVIPNFRGITVATIIDSAKGEVGKLHFDSNESSFIKRAGEPNPQKFGTYIYSALNALQMTDKFFWARVDKGQTYATMLVRSKIAPTVEYDAYGYRLAEPKVDPIVKPNGAMSKEQWESFVFPDYPRTREIGHFEPDVHIKILPKNGDTRFVIDNTSNIQKGDYITFKDTTGMDREEAMQYNYYQVVEVGEAVVTQDYITTEAHIPSMTPVGTEIKKVIERGVDNGTTLQADANIGDTTLSVNDANLWQVGDKVAFTTDLTLGVYTIVSIDTSNNTITLDNGITEAYSAGTPVYKAVKQYVSFNYPVYIKWIDPEDNTKIMVTSNDPIIEGEAIEINGIETVMTSKYQLDNKINYIDVDKEYQQDTPLVVGSVVYKVVHTDWEQRDAFLIRAESPGEWGNKIAVAIRDSKEYAQAFWVDVYYDGILVESHHCTREPFTDGYGRQMFIEDVINTRSEYIRVKDNPLMVDDEGNPTEPLKTLYYYKQRQKEALYYPVATIVETVWDGDNYIRVRPEDIVNIDVLKKVKIAGKLYDIAEISKSCGDCTYDTIVLKQPIDLSDLSSLLPIERKLEIGTPVEQSYDRAKVVDLFGNYQDGVTYKVIVKGHNGSEYGYAYTSVSGDDMTVVYTKLAEAINNENNPFVDASVTTAGNLRLTADVAGVDFGVETENLNYVVVKENARAWKVYPLEKVDGKVLPTATIGAIVTQSGINYVIWDAGANMATGGDDAGFPTVGQFLRALDLFKDPEKVDFIVFMDAGVTDVSYAQAITEMCEKRMDCVGLLSVSFDSQATPDILDVVKYRENLHINSSYVALYAPWVQVYDKYNDLAIYVSPESFACKAIVVSERTREIWYPPMGWNRGKVYARNVYKTYDKGQRDLLYDNQINTIRVHPQRGMAIWGQKTMQVQASATDRVNVRLLLIVIERGIKDLLENYIGELNEPDTQAHIKSIVESYLIDIRSRKGIYGFNVICDDTNNTPQRIANHELYLDVIVSPVQGIEYPIGRIGIVKKGDAKVVTIDRQVA